jgi:SulP family sulfate permease
MSGARSTGLGGLLRRYLPILDWGREYSRQTLTGDLIAAAIVSIMLIPQSLAYALLVGVPPQVGLYASMAPLVLYAVFGTSRALAVGPVAVASLMTAAAAGQVAAAGTPEFLGAAIALSAVTGLLLILMGMLRLGFLANFLSHPVVSGFITAAAVQIAAGQLGALLGASSKGESLLEILHSLLPSLDKVNPATAAIGIAAVVFLLWARRGLKPLLLGLGLGERPADILSKVAPAMVIVATTLAVWGFNLDARSVAILGTVPGGLPAIALPPVDVSLWTKLLVPSLLICIVGYVESISVALTLAAKRRQRVDPDQELIALGAADLGSAVSGGFPITGALSRSVVNFDAGAQTPAAGAFTAVGVAIATLFLTPLLFFLPKAALAAIIIVAVLSLVDIGAIKHTWAYSRADFAAMIGTIVVTWLDGVEAGLVVGVGVSIFLHLYKTSRPHVAVVGQIPGTTSFRNVARHAVVTDPEILSLRVDESLYFPNARFLEDLINDAVAANRQVRHVILECPAVNTIDASALQSLEAINHRLADGGITFHLSEVKGPVMDQLKRSHFLQELSGKVHLSHFDAVASIKPELAQSTRAAPRDTPAGASGVASNPPSQPT